MHKWETFAREDPHWYILAPFHGDTDKFWETGAQQARGILGDVDGYLRNHNTVTEIGCGVGRCLLPVSRSFAQATGVDVSQTMLHLLSENAALHGLQGRILSFFPTEPWDDHPADLIFSVKTFYYISEFQIIEDYVCKVARSRSRDGVAYLQFDTRPVSIFYRVRNLLPDFLLPRKWRDGIRRIRRNRATLLDLFQKYGLSVLDEKYITTSYHVFLLARSPSAEVWA